eukprot:275082_1
MTNIRITKLATKRMRDEYDEDTEDENTIKISKSPPAKKMKTESINLTNIIKSFYEIIYNLNNGNWIQKYLKEYKVFKFKQFPHKAPEIILDFRNILMNRTNTKAIHSVLCWLQSQRFFMKCKKLTIYSNENGNPLPKHTLYKQIHGMNKIKKLKIVGLNIKECIEIISNINHNEPLSKLQLENIKCDDMDLDIW